MSHFFDVIIVGAGPAGCACTYMLKDSGLKVAMLEKGSFPKDKICGDGLTLDIVQQLERMNPDLARRFESLSQKIPSYGIRVISPSNEEMLIPFLKNGQKANYYLCERKVFDQFLYEQCLQNENLNVFLDTRVEEVRYVESGVAIRTNRETLRCSLVVGADGAHSAVASSLLRKPIDRRHHIAGLRRYYSNVEGLNPDNYLEILFLKPILPGYLWIFPLPGGKANVGIGVLSSSVSKKRLDLKKMFNDFLATDPNLKERFKHAQPLEPVKGHGLPLASRGLRRSGDRFVLLGDAGSLIDPLTGEGVGNAIRSGRFAADVIMAAFQLQRFDSSFLKKYDDRLKRAMGSEIRLNTFVQKMIAFPAVTSFLINRVNRSEYLIKWITETMHSESKSPVKTMTKVLYKLLVSP